MSLSLLPLISINEFLLEDSPKPRISILVLVESTPEFCDRMVMPESLLNISGIVLPLNFLISSLEIIVMFDPAKPVANLE